MHVSAGNKTDEANYIAEDKETIQSMILKYDSQNMNSSWKQIQLNIEAVSSRTWTEQALHIAPWQACR